MCQRGILVPGGKDGSASRNTSEHKGYIFSKLCLADKRGTRAAKCLRGVESFFLFLERGGDEYRTGLSARARKDRAGYCVTERKRTSESREREGEGEGEGEDVIVSNARLGKTC